MEKHETVNDQIKFDIFFKIGRKKYHWQRFGNTLTNCTESFRKVMAKEPFLEKARLVAVMYANSSGAKTLLADGYRKS